MKKIAFGEYPYTVVEVDEIPEVDDVLPRSMLRMKSGIQIPASCQVTFLRRGEPVLGAIPWFDVKIDL